MALEPTFRCLCEGRFDPSVIVTGYTGLAGVPALFEQLRPHDPRHVDHLKVLVRHDLDRSEIVAPADATDWRP